VTERNEYRKVILPLTVLRRFDCLLAPTKAQVLKEHAAIKTKPESVVRSLLEKITQRPFYNLSKMDFAKLLDDPNQLAPNLNGYINGFSKNVRDIMERFAFDQQIARMAEKNLLYEVIKAFSRIDLSPVHVDNEVRCAPATRPTDLKSGSARQPRPIDIHIQPVHFRSQPGSAAAVPG